jgi:hypothetical protein
MMVALFAQNVDASRAIRALYAPQLEALMLDKYSDLAGALDTGRLAPLPADPLRFNLAPRLEGPHPIGEKDLRNQASYIAARPATLGLLLEVASRVKSGPLEITSLVRHAGYQDSLRGSNVNANTSVPMHTMGLAFDIALVNTPLETIREIRNVLVELRDAGDLMFVGERRQLVFHVVPHPARLAHFTDVYNRRVGVASQVHGAHVIAAAPAARQTGTGRTPRVTAEVIAILPTDEFAREWWVGETHSHEQAPSSALAAVLAGPGESAPANAGLFGSRWLMVLVSALSVGAGLVRQQRDQRGRHRRTEIFPALDASRVAADA